MEEITRGLAISVIVLVSVYASAYRGVMEPQMIGGLF
jgi:hypothetical protein